MVKTNLFMLHNLQFYIFSSLQCFTELVYNVES